jgi:predicted ferric reductase
MRMVKGEVYFPIIIGVHFLLWALALLLYDGPFTLGEGENPVQRILGEMISSWVITVLGFNLLMATRARWIERIFGGLDKMYLIHRRAGVIAIVLLFLHFGIVPRHPEFTVGKPLGFAAMALILLGVMLSVASLFKRRIRYHKWLSVHRLMGPFYLLGVCHAFLVPTLISRLPLVRAYVFGMAFVGIASWLYCVFLRLRVHPRIAYEVAAVRRFGGSVLELEMAPVDAPMQFLPGQFAFFRFPGINPREAHPFTVASRLEEGPLRVAIKASGDFTESLQTQAEEGQPVQVEGPYGHFTQKWSSSRRQVWVAGGIGITPFLALARDLRDTVREVVLYWTVRTEQEACFDDELRDLAECTPGLTYHLWLSNNDGRLTADAMAETKQAEDLDVFICGPEALRDSLTDQLHVLGVPGRNIHSEEFSFR